MTLDEIKKAHNSGKRVFWKNDGYRVMRGTSDQWYIVCLFNDHRIGLTWTDGVTMNGKPEDFYVNGTED